MPIRTWALTAVLGFELAVLIFATSWSAMARILREVVSLKLGKL